jgi:hypothetical protein
VAVATVCPSGGCCIVGHDGGLCEKSSD